MLLGGFGQSEDVLMGMLVMASLRRKGLLVDAVNGLPQEALLALTSRGGRLEWLLLHGSSIGVEVLRRG